MKTLVDRMADAMDSSSSARVRASRVAEIVEQHDAVMAQMAEALRKLNDAMQAYGFSHGTYEDSQAALSAYQSLGEQSNEN